MTSGKERTSFRKSWTTDMWSWAKRKWHSRGGDSRHDREHLYSEHCRTDRAANRADIAPVSGAAKRCFAEKPQDARLSRGRVAGDCCGAVQFVRQEDARATGRRQRATTATDFAGQHRQQRAGIEEPTSGGTSERAASDSGRSCDGRSCPYVCDNRA